MTRTKRLLNLVVIGMAATGALRGQDTGTTAVQARIDQLESRVNQLEQLVRDLLDHRGIQDTALVTTQQESAGKGVSASTVEATSASVAPVPQARPQPNSMNIYWKEGLRLDSADEAFKLQIGGRIQNDWMASSIDDPLESRFGALRGGTEFRRARIKLAGTIHDRFEYKAEYDFSGSVVDGLPSGASFTDVYMGLANLRGVGTIQVGHQKEPFGLEELTSSVNITFMERAVTSVFTPARNTGVLLQNTAAGNRVNWAFGAFREAGPKGAGIGDEGYALTGRLAGQPLFRDGGKEMLHLGMAYSYRKSPFSALLFRERPEAHLAPRFVNTGVFPADSENRVGFEGAWVQGPFSLQGEYMLDFTNASAVGDPTFKAGYLQGSFFLTGEGRAYRQSSATFDRTKPARNFFQEAGGAGAWELAARYSFLDLNDKGINGGEMNNLSLGLNWHLNPNSKLMWNYIFSDVRDVGQGNIFQTRFQVDF